MGVLKCCAILFALVAVVVGLFVSGFIAEKTPLLQFIDEYQFERGQLFKGFIPAFHVRTPWGFTYDELAATDLTGQTILVTGGNIGLGYWTAYHLATQNAEVVIMCRNEKKCIKAAEDIKKETGKVVTPMQGDLSSFQSIKSFIQEFKAKYTRLDSLILNAGIAQQEFALSTDGIELTMAVNHFGQFYLTTELMPLIEKAASTSTEKVATIVVVSSMAHYDTFPEGILPSLEEMNNPSRFVPMVAYGQSKLANVFFAQELAERYKSKNILVNSLHPGLVRTQMQLKAIESTQDISDIMRDPVSMFTEAISWTAKDGALTQVYCAIGKKLKANKISGKYFHPIAREIKPDAHTFNKEMQTHLWNLSEKVVKDYVK